MTSAFKGKDLRKLTRLELYELAKKLDIKGRSSLSKQEMIDRISKPQARGNAKPDLKPSADSAKTSARAGKKPHPSFREPPKKIAKQKILPPMGEIKKGYVSPVPDQQAQELPTTYGDTRIVVQVRDPYWAHAYWDISEESRIELLKSIGEENLSHCRYVIRINDVTAVDFNGGNANSFFDCRIFPDARTWYLHLGRPDRRFVADLGVISPNGSFTLITRSNIFQTPRTTFSDRVDEKWMASDEKLNEVFNASKGAGQSAGKTSWERPRAVSAQFLEGVASGGGVSSLSSPAKRSESTEAKDFWLVVNTELVVYGATQPDARLTIQGKEARLRPDGTFSVRFALPDGEQIIPIQAVNSDGDKQRVITPVIKKETR